MTPRRGDREKGETCGERRQIVMERAKNFNFCPFYVKVDWLLFRSLWTEFMSLNVVTLVGRVGGDPNVKYLNSGSVVCNLTLAVDRWTRNGKETDWFNLEVWDKTAEIAANYVRKGTQIGIKGSLKFDYWQDNNTGANRSKPVIRVYQLDLLSSKQDRDGNMRETDDEL